MSSLDDAFNRWRSFKLNNLYRGSLLTMGIVEANQNMVKEALEAGENPNKRYSYEVDNDSITTPNPVRKITPIVQAAVVNSLPITMLLVDYGADVNMCQENGESAWQMPSIEAMSSLRPICLNMEPTLICKDLLGRHLLSQMG